MYKHFEGGVASHPNAFFRVSGKREEALAAIKMIDTRASTARGGFPYATMLVNGAPSRRSGI